MLDQGIDEAEVMRALRELHVRHFHSSFQFLDVHMGIRRGCYSVVMGSTGSGKTGLAQAIAVHTASTPNTKVLMILTEEEKNSYAGPILAYAKCTGSSLDNLTFFEESSMDHNELKSHDDFLAALKEVIASSFADVVIIDNATTGRLYGTGTSPWDQEKTTWFFKNPCKDLNIHIMVVAHTKKEVTDNMGRLMTNQDHQVVASLGKEASFFYALQKFTQGPVTHVFLRTLKHRGYPDANGTFYLKYDKDFRLYVGDQKVDFEKMKEVFGARDMLGPNKQQR